VRYATQGISTSGALYLNVRGRTYDALCCWQLGAWSNDVATICRPSFSGWMTLWKRSSISQSLALNSETQCGGATFVLPLRRDCVPLYLFSHVMGGGFEIDGLRSPGYHVSPKTGRFPSARGKRTSETRRRKASPACPLGRGPFVTHSRYLAFAGKGWRDE